MPYIKKEQREKYLSPIEELVSILNSQSKDSLDGQVNYVITVLMKRVYKPDSYNTLNSAIGVLESIKQEFYRKVVVPYEEDKERDNGEVI